MKFHFSLIVLLLLASKVWAQENTQKIYSSDVYHFWEAYDQIIATQDSAKQYQLLQELYFDKGSPGLTAIRQARRYSDKDYIDAINNHPLFWESIRPNTLKAIDYAEEISKGLEGLKKIYPHLKPAQIYFTVGAFRTPGTTLDSLVLIGSELAMTNKNTLSHEFEPRFDYLRNYFDSEPIKEIVFLNIHEYVHTQQVFDYGYDLLTFSLYEGFAEFMAVKASAKASPTPAIEFGKRNDDWVKTVFSQEMFSYYYDRWLWNNFENEFKMRDLGYYMGYAIAEKYYEAAEDKQAAIKTLIELDFKDKESVWNFVDGTHYFEKPLAEYEADYESRRPTVTKLINFENGSQEVDPNISEIRIAFSHEMQPGYYSTGYGEKGRDYLPQIEGVRFTEDNKGAIYEVKLEAGKEYQFMVGMGFRLANGVQLKPYEISFRTKSP
ncbi:MAG: hypothetical protein R8P61_29765 [Bacteroidia bacterium]|nr:hypothetical protein [Bacteroidia bacterium]